MKLSKYLSALLLIFVFVGFSSSGIAGEVNVSHEVEVSSVFVDMDSVPEKVTDNRIVVASANEVGIEVKRTKNESFRINDWPDPVPASYEEPEMSNSSIGVNMKLACNSCHANLSPG